MATNSELESLCPIVLGPVSRTTKELAKCGAVIYARVSTLEQQDGSSIQNQIDKCIEYAGQTLKIPIKLITYDKGISGTDAQRPGLLHALSVATKGDTLLLHSLSRLTRTARAGMDMIGDMQDKGVACITLEKGVDTSTPHGRFTRLIQLGFAELERDMISARVKEGMAKRKAIAGDAWATNERYGYQWGEPDEKGKKGRLIPYEPEHAILRTIVAAALTPPFPTLKQLADIANSREGNTRKWWPDNIKKLLDAEGVPSKKSERSACGIPHAKSDPEMHVQKEDNGNLSEYEEEHTTI